MLFTGFSEDVQDVTRATEASKNQQDCGSGRIDGLDIGKCVNNAKPLWRLLTD